MVHMGYFEKYLQLGEYQKMENYKVLVHLLAQAMIWTHESQSVSDIQSAKHVFCNLCRFIALIA